MRARQKLHDRTGFTLAEMLAAVLILLLVSVIVASGVPAAKNAYEKVTLSANAQVLLSTTVTALRDELDTANDIRVDGTTIDYFDSDIGSQSQLYLTDKGVIMLQQFIAYDGDNNTVAAVDARPLVSFETATNDMYVTYDSVAYDASLAPELITFSDVKVCHGTTELATLETLVIRVVAAP